MFSRKPKTVPSPEGIALFVTGTDAAAFCIMLNDSYATPDRPMYAVLPTNEGPYWWKVISTESLSVYANAVAPF